MYATRGARLVSATLDGRALSASFGRSDPTLQVSTEGGRPIWEVLADLAPGQTRTFVLRLLEPTAGGTPQVPEQPLGTPLKRSVHVPTC